MNIKELITSIESPIDVKDCILTSSYTDLFIQGFYLDTLPGKAIKKALKEEGYHTFNMHYLEGEPIKTRILDDSNWVGVYYGGTLVIKPETITDVRNLLKLTDGAEMITVYVGETFSTIMTVAVPSKEDTEGR